METLVQILGETFELQTERLHSHPGWIAAGNFKGHRIRGTASTKPGAVARWRRQALDMQVIITRPSKVTWLP